MKIKTKVWKDWKYLYKVIAALLVFAVLIDTYTTNIVGIANSGFDFDGIDWRIILDDSKTSYGNDYQGFTIRYLSFFTIQSNIMVLIWFFVSALKHSSDKKTWKKSIILSREATISITIYIIITGVVYNSVILPASLMSGKIFNAHAWFQQMMLHLIIPLLMFLYVFLFNDRTFVAKSFRNFAKKDMLYAMIYPIIYLIYSLLRGEMIFRAYNSNWDLAKPHRPYPYFFLEVHNPTPLKGLPISGPVLLILTIPVIIGFIIGLGALLNWKISKDYDLAERISNNK